MFVANLGKKKQKQKKPHQISMKEVKNYKPEETRQPRQQKLIDLINSIFL